VAEFKYMDVCSNGKLTLQELHVNLHKLNQSPFGRAFHKDYTDKLGLNFKLIEDVSQLFRIIDVESQGSISRAQYEQFRKTPLADILIKLYALNPDNEMALRAVNARAEQKEQRRLEQIAALEQAKIKADQELLKTAAREGFRVMNLYRAKVGHGTAWAVIHPQFRFVVNADNQLLIRIERDADYLPGMRRPVATPDARFANLERAEIVTGTWCVKDLHKVELVTGPFENEQLQGCAFSVWVRVGDFTRALHLWAPGSRGQAVMQGFSRALEIASSRLMYLGIKLGSKARESEQAPVMASKRLSLGITPRSSIIELAQNPKELRSLVTSGALHLRGEDASSVWTKGYSTCADDLRLVISRTWKSTDERRKVAEKLRLAGAITCQDLVDLMETRAPRDATYLPTWSFFRGQACLLNYRIDVNGGKLLKSATMETLHKLSFLPIDAEVGYAPAHGHLPIAEESQELWKLVQTLWPKADVDSQDVTFMKLLRAGARTVSDLRRLIAEEGPVGCLLPPSCSFRGRSCMLNFNIDELGGKLFTSSTLETLFMRAEYQIMFKPTLRQTQTCASTIKHKKSRVQLEEETEKERRLLLMQSFVETVSQGSEAKMLFRVTKPQKTLRLKDGQSVSPVHIAFSHDCKLMAITRSDGIVNIAATGETGETAGDWKPLHGADLVRHQDTVNFCCFRPPDSEAYLPDRYVSICRIAL
jgi:hypothetical protein